MHLKFNGFNPVICRYDEAIATLLAAEMLQMSFTGFPKRACSKNTDLPEANTIKNKICQKIYHRMNGDHFQLFIHKYIIIFPTTLTFFNVFQPTKPILPE
jgi:hypothetical protein